MSNTPSRASRRHIILAEAKQVERCHGQKMGEYNNLRCCLDEGHAGDHNYVIDRSTSE